MACKLAGISRTNAEVADMWGIDVRHVTRTSELVRQTLASDDTEPHTQTPPHDAWREAREILAEFESVRHRRRNNWTRAPRRRGLCTELEAVAGADARTENHRRGGHLNLHRQTPRREDHRREMRGHRTNFTQGCRRSGDLLKGETMIVITKKNVDSNKTLPFDPVLWRSVSGEVLH